MRIPYTILNLLHQKKRTAIALAGVAFSNLLIFMQLGFLGSAESAAVILYKNLDYDLILLAPGYVDVNRPSSFQRERLYHVSADPDVLRVMPVYTGANGWRIVKPGDPQDGFRRSIQVIGFDIHDEPFRTEELKGLGRKLRSPDAVLIDRTSRDYFGERGPGVQTDLGLIQVRVVGDFRIGTGFGSDGLLITSDQTFGRAFGGQSLDRVNLGLIKLRPGASAAQVAQHILDRLPGQHLEPLRVYTRHEIEKKEVNFWVNQTSVGQIFMMGVGVAVLVGIIFVYQVISSDIKNRISEFATLKAIGYSNSYLNWVVLEQACWYGLLGFFPALFIAMLLYQWLAATTALPIAMSWQRAVSVAIMALAMCAASGIMAVRRVKQLDPADLF